MYEFLLTLNCCDEFIDYDKIFEWAFEILEGKNIADDVAAFAQQKNVAPGKVNRISTAVSALLW